jgi:hypothetical protein
VEGGFADILRPETWLEPSWFLVIPLLLNTCVLCPIIIQRTLRARREEGGRPDKRLTTINLVVAGILGVTAIAYMLLVAVHSWK